MKSLRELPRIALKFNAEENLGFSQEITNRLM